MANILLSVARSLPVTDLPFLSASAECRTGLHLFIEILRERNVFML